MLLTVAVAAADFKQGETVEAQWGGEWKRARIIAVKPGTPRPFKVHFEGYDSSRDNWLTAAELRAAGAAPVPAPVAAGGAGTLAQPSVLHAHGQWV